MDNGTQQNSVFKTIQIIYGAFVLGIILFSIFTYFSINPTFSIYTNDIFMVVVPVTALGGIVLSKFLYSSLINKISSNDDLSSKLAQYQSATLIKGACLEGPALLSIMATFITENSLFLLLALMLVGVMYLKFPKKEKFKEEIVLSFEEKTEFDRQ